MMIQRKPLEAATPAGVNENLAPKLDKGFPYDDPEMFAKKWVDEHRLQKGDFVNI